MCFRKNINQENFIQKANKMSAQFEIQKFNKKGICDALSNTYIKYSSRRKQDEYFALVAFESRELSKIKSFCEFVKDEECKDFMWLDDRICFDAFTLTAFGSSELTRKIDFVLQNLQKRKVNLYLKTTIAYLHSFVIEQIHDGKNFIYFVYDPNNSKKPDPLYTSKDISNEIINVISRIVFPFQCLYPLFDNHYIFNFYVYPNEVHEFKDVCIERMIARVDELIKNNQDLFDDAKLLLARFKNRCAARGVVLNNIHFQFVRIQYEHRINLDDEIKLLENEKSKHVLSANLISSNSNKLSNEYFCSFGKSTLLHEIARLGDIAALHQILPYVNFFIKDSFSYTPLECAINSCEFPVAKRLILHMEKHEKLNYTALKTHAMKITNSLGMALRTKYFKDMKDKANLLEDSAHALLDFICKKSRYLETSSAKITSVQKYSFFTPSTMNQIKMVSIIFCLLLIVYKLIFSFKENNKNMLKHFV